MPSISMAWRCSCGSLLSRAMANSASRVPFTGSTCCAGSMLPPGSVWCVVASIPAAVPGDLDPILDSRWVELGDAPREIDAWARILLDLDDTTYEMAPGWF